MSKYFDKTFFKFLFGFIFILIISLITIIIASYYEKKLNGGSATQEQTREQVQSFKEFSDNSTKDSGDNCLTDKSC